MENSRWETTGQEHTKECTKCHRVLPYQSFTKAAKGRYLRPECVECTARIRTEITELKQKHGSAPDGHVCPICLKNAEEAKLMNNSSFVLDHCHTTGEFRGWLCHRCNMALGQLQDDVAAVQRALNYLKGINNENN